MKFNVTRFLAMLRKEFLQLKRDPISLRLALVMPILMMFVLGYAINVETTSVSIAVFDQSKTQQSREYIEEFAVSGYFNLKCYVTSEQELEDALDSGKVKGALIVPATYVADVQQNKIPSTELIIDGTDPTTARTAMSSGLMVSEAYTKSLALNSMKMANQDASGQPLCVRVWYNPKLDAKKFTVPGQVALILQNLTVFLTAFALVKEKEKGTIEHLIVTPIRPFEIILAKIIPYVVIGYAGFLVALSIGVFWFDVSIAGSVTLLLALGLIFVVCSLSIGMLASTFARSQFQAMLMVALFILPSTLLSGFVFPREAMPSVIYAIGYLLPITYFLNITRMIILKGLGIGFLWNDIIPLTLLTIVLLAVATSRIKKSIN